MAAASRAKRPQAPGAPSVLQVSGRVNQHTKGAISGLLVEALQVEGRTGRRLGSTEVDASGLFSINIERDATASRKAVDLQIRVFGPDSPGVERKQRLLFESEIRHGAAAREYFIVELPQDAIDKTGLPKASATRVARDTQAALAAGQERAALRRKIADKAFVTALTEVKERRDLFRDSIRGALSEAMSTVTPEDRKRGRFVATPDDIVKVGAAALAEDLGTFFGTRDPQHGDERAPIERTTRLRLTKQQFAQLVGNSTTPVLITEADLEAALGTTLDQPAHIYRRSAADDPCRPRSTAEACLDGDADHHHPTTPDPTPGANPPLPGVQAPAFDSRRAIDELMERQTSPEDPLLFGPNGTSRLLESGLKAEGVSDAIAQITFAPGPADVPALHFFSDLQIAFEPIWQEALNDRFLNNVEAAYDRFVERGGAPAVAHVKNLFGVGGLINPGHFLDALFDLGSSADASYESVTSVIIISREEWNALPKAARDHLAGIAAKMSDLREDLLASIDASDTSLFDILLGEGTIPDMIRSGLAPLMSPDAIEIRTKLRLLKSDADGIVALARRLVLEAESLRPFRPTHSVIEELKQQHSKAYPFRHFAASPQYRSINFGLRVIYKQIWTKKAYQVGELISILPLAPMEERTYSQKTVRRTKRAVEEVESRYERRTGETEERTRIESEIVHRATAKTNFAMSSTGTVSYGAGGGGGEGGEQGGGGGMGFSGSSTTSMQRDVEKHSDSIKREFNDAIRKATEELKQEQKRVITTEQSTDEETTKSGVIKNPNNEITCTFLFYELQRRVAIEEKIHGLESVIFVAQEVPAPSELTPTWLIRHDWILSRVLLDPSFAPALGYVSTTLISDDVALREMREALFRQRKLVEDLKQDLADLRSLSGLRYGALQKQIERTAKSADSGGGLLGGIVDGLGDLVSGVPIVGDLVGGALDMVTGGDGEVSEADQLREGAARDAYEREQREEQDVASRVMSALSTLESMQRDYTERLSRHLAQLGQVHRLIDHVWQNILYYMQAIWSHEPDDQRFLRLKDVPVPIFARNKLRNLKINPAVFAAATDIAAIDTKWVHLTGGLSTPFPLPVPVDKIRTKPLSQVANIYKPAGVVGNYLVFPMYEANPITEMMMAPYVTLAEGEYGVSDPDPVGNMTLDEFADYVCCLRKHYQENGSGDEFEKLKPELRDTLKKLLQRSRRDGDIVIPCEDGLYIEALPGVHSVMEQFKQLHRIIDVKGAQADVRAKELNNIRRAEMILKENLADPDVEAVKNVYYHGATAPHDGDE
jgi:hypothetical protein